MTTRYSRIVWHNPEVPGVGGAGEWFAHDLAPFARDLDARYPPLVHRVEYMNAPDVSAIVADLFAAGRKSSERAA